VCTCAPWGLGALRGGRCVGGGECPPGGRAPASVRVTGGAARALARRADRVEDARALAARRFPGPGWGFEVGGYCGTPDAIVRRIEEGRALGGGGFGFFLHDRAEPRAARLLAPEGRAAGPPSAS